MEEKHMVVKLIGIDLPGSRQGLSQLRPGILDNLYKSIRKLSFRQELRGVVSSA